MKPCLRNCAYIVLFPSLRDRSSVGVLARRCFADKAGVLIGAFAHLLANPNTISYLILDLRPRLDTEHYRIRQSFCLEDPIVSYRSK